MKDISGLTFLKALAYCDLDKWSWKMCEGISRSGWLKFSKGLPKTGMMRNGMLYELQMSEHPIKEPESSLLPTPTVMHVRNHNEPIQVFLDRQQRSSTGQIGMSTGVAVRLATPTTNISHTTGRCRNWGADLLHDVKCPCKKRQMRWLAIN